MKKKEPVLCERCKEEIKVTYCAGLCKKCHEEIYESDWTGYEDGNI